MAKLSDIALLGVVGTIIYLLIKAGGGIADFWNKLFPSAKPKMIEDFHPEWNNLSNSEKSDIIEEMFITSGVDIGEGIGNLGLTTGELQTIAEESASDYVKTAIAQSDSGAGYFMGEDFDTNIITELKEKVAVTESQTYPKQIAYNQYGFLIHTEWEEIQVKDLLGIGSGVDIMTYVRNLTIDEIYSYAAYWYQILHVDLNRPEWYSWLYNTVVKPIQAEKGLFGTPTLQTATTDLYVPDVMAGGVSVETVDVVPVVSGSYEYYFKDVWRDAYELVVSSNNPADNYGSPIETYNGLPVYTTG